MGTSDQRPATSDQAGYSMIELLLTLVFVALGTQMVQGSFLKAADMFGRYSNTLRTVLWSEAQASLARETLLRDEFVESANGTLNFSNKELAWQREATALETRNLYSIRLSTSWSESGKPQRFEKEFYVYKKDLSQGL